MLQPFRLQEDLVPILVGEAHHLVLDRRAVARPAALDLPRVHRRAVQVRADQVVDRLVGVGDVAIELRLRDPVGREAERPRIVVAGLQLALREVDGAAVEPAGRAGLEARELEAAASRLSLSALGRLSPARPPRVFASPVCMSALRNVPVVRMTACAR